MVEREDREGRGEGWEIYRAREKWTAKGDYLVWKDEETEE